ncbi:MAG: tRNA1(Val) (adenine(37)-N6)-methyltransferase [Clostridia bacterium]|jgi:tRNA1(Val) A37 N6-methylase TrmN6
MINEDERIDDLQYKGLKLIQKKNGFCFGVDAVLISNFADVKKGDEVIDLGTGTGIIPILIAGKTLAKSITGLEIQPEMSDMARRSVLLNDLSERVMIETGDIKKSLEYFKKASFDVVVTNPPYMNAGGGLLNPSDTKAISRHEILCSLEDVVEISSKLLKPNGLFSMIHRPERLVDIICLMRQYKIEPKYLRFVYPSPYKKANLIMIKGTLFGKPQLNMMGPLYVYNEKGRFSDEIEKIYCRESKGKSEVLNETNK